MTFLRLVKFIDINFPPNAIMLYSNQNSIGDLKLLTNYQFDDRKYDSNSPQIYQFYGVSVLNLNNSIKI